MKIKNRVPLIIGLLIVALAGLGYYLNMALIPQLKLKNLEYQEKKEILAAKKEELAAVQELDSMFSALQKQAGVALNALPSDKEIPEILYQLTSIADEKGLVSTNLVINAGAVTDPRSTVQSIHFSLSLAGDYQGIVRYLEKIETSLRLINIGSVSFSSSSTLGEKVKEVVNATIEGDAYFQMTAAPTTTKRTIQ
jgi:type IV pilus assembly protein PilO